MYIVVELESSSETGSNSDASGDAYNITNNAFGLIDDIELLIGDQVIDKHSGEWLSIYTSLFTHEAKNLAICDMVDIYKNVKYQNNKDGLVFIPLFFWFNRNPGLALPLLALQYSDVRLRLKLNSNALIFNNGIGDNNSSGVSINKIQLLTEFIHLDTDEKSLFASSSHEYLIEQIQFSEKEPIESEEELTDTDYNNYQHRFDLEFNHPVKALFWSVQDDESSDGLRAARGNQLFNYWNDLNAINRKNNVRDASISVNGYEMFDPLPGIYFNLVTKNEHFTGNGFTGLKVLQTTNNQQSIDLSTGNGIYTYPFALYPEEYQPSGTLNFSKLDKSELRLRINRTQGSSDYGRTYIQKYLKVYALNYNVLRIASGSGGLVFEN